MKYTLEIDLDLPRDSVIELFDNPDNVSQWQPDLIGFEHESGDPGRVGARSRLRYTMGKKEIEMIETITSRQLPDEFSATYEAKGVWNQVVHRFIDVGPNQTRWVLDAVFRCNGSMSVMAFLMPGMFKKQTLKYMQQFKAFAEGQLQKA